MARRPRATAVSFVLAVAASVAFLFLPSGTSVTAAPSTDGSPTSTVVTHHTLLEHEGASVLVVLAVPVLVAALGFAVRASLARILAAFLLWAFSVLGAATVGLFYVPAAVAMTIAAFFAAETTE